MHAMVRKELDIRDFKPHEVARLHSHLDELLPIFANSELLDLDLIIEGGVGRGIFPLLLIQNLCKQLDLVDVRYVGFDVLTWVSGRKQSVALISEEAIKTTLNRQPPFSAHGVVMYHQENATHCLADNEGAIYPDNNVLCGDCFAAQDVSKVMRALGRTNPVFVAYNAIGALLDEAAGRPERWFQSEIPYTAWIFLSHLATPWESQNASPTEEFYFSDDWLHILEAATKENLLIHLLKNGIVITR